MKTPDNRNAKPNGGKQKKQLVALGALSALLVGVMVTQFGDEPEEYEVAALAVAPDAVQPASEQVPADAVPQPVTDNAVLSAPPPEEGLSRSPFSNFWSSPSSSPTAVPDLAAPLLTVNATLPSETQGMAVIDGALHFVGDTIGGWQLAEVRARAIVLRGPSATGVAVIEMPLLEGQVELPQLQAPMVLPPAPASGGR